jgi:hypothetical protein
MNDTDSHREDPANVIGKVDSRAVAEAVGAFPSAQHATIDVIHIPGKLVDGREALVTFERYSYKHYRSRFWAWRMTRAVLVADPTAGVQVS